MRRKKLKRFKVVKNECEWACSLIYNYMIINLDYHNKLVFYIYAENKDEVYSKIHNAKELNDFMFFDINRQDKYYTQPNFKKIIRRKRRSRMNSTNEPHSAIKKIGSYYL